MYQWLAIYFKSRVCFETVRIYNFTQRIINQAPSTQINIPSSPYPKNTQPIKNALLPILPLSPSTHNNRGRPPAHIPFIPPAYHPPFPTFSLSLSTYLSPHFSNFTRAKICTGERNASRKTASIFTRQGESRLRQAPPHNLPRPPLPSTPI